MKGGKHTTYYLNCLGKAFDKIQHPLMIKSLSKLGVEKLSLNIVWPYMKSPQATLYSKVKDWKLFL